jgi:mitotic spindle assembly checkpoint protein MAD1
LKSSHTNVELLKEKILEEQGCRERAEMELSKLQEIEAKAQKLELELASCTALLSNIPDVSSFGDIPQKIADLQKQALTNLNKVGEVTSQLKELKVALEFADLSKQRAEGEATLAKERAESATREIKRLELLVLLFIAIFIITTVMLVSTPPLSAMQFCRSTCGTIASS